MPGDCAGTRAAIGAYRTGGPPADRDVTVAGHLASCGECRGAWEDLLGEADERLVARAFRESPVREGFVEGVLGRLEAEGAPARQPETETESAEVLDSGDFLDSGLIRSGAAAPRGRAGMGMVLQYCEKCGERIESADVEKGVAVTYRAKIYCGNCKVAVLPLLEKDPEYQAQQRAAVRDRERAARRGSGASFEPPPAAAVREPDSGRRSAAAARPAKSPVPLLVAGGVGVVLLVAVGLVVVSGQGDTPKKDGSKGGPKTSATPGAKDSGGGRSPAGPEASPTAPGGMQREIQSERVTTKVRDEFQAVREFEKKTQQQMLRPDDVILRYKRLLDWPEMKDVPDLRKEIVAAADKFQSWYDTQAKDAAKMSVAKAEGLIAQRNFRGARNALESYPPNLRSHPEFDRVKEVYAQIDAAEEEQRRELAFELGPWNTLCEGGKPLPVIKFNGTVTHEETEGAMVASAPADSQGSTLVLDQRIPQRDWWANYEVEMEAKFDEGVQVGMRITINPETGRYQGAGCRFDAEEAKDYHKWSFKCEGEEFEVIKDGKQEAKLPCNFRRGFPIVIVPAGKSVRIKTMRIKVSSALTPGGR
ncbi:MAG: hypothetical protein L0216_09790 [Planctomycetales bacterium]|nr:hypothetical protein [Planctomycetales bacterium]